jgi:hypothetical protein
MRYFTFDEFPAAVSGTASLAGTVDVNCVGLCDKG